MNRLDVWKAIASHAGRSERQVQRWAVERGFPVHRVPGGGSVFGWPQEIDEWFKSSAAAGADTSGEISQSQSPENRASHSEFRSVDVATNTPPTFISTLAASSSRVMRREVFLTLCVGVIIGATGTWLGTRPWVRLRVVTPVCHVVDWPTQPLPAQGGRFSIAVRATNASCLWQQPVFEDTWLIVTPPSFSPTPPRLHGNGVPPFALPPYDPNASHLWLEVAANRMTTPRSLALTLGNQRISITQAGLSETCTSEPGPGFVHDGWRYRITARRYDDSVNLLKALREEVGLKAQPVSWSDLATFLTGHPDTGVQFDDAVGLARHTWEENFEPENCITYWLPTPYHAPSGSYPDFLAYHLNRKQASFGSFFELNDNQFDLGRFHQTAQILYRERADELLGASR